MSARCPWCHKLNDSTTGLATTTKQPKRGDAAICFYCAKPAVYTGHGTQVRKPTGKELIRFETDPVMTRIRNMISARTSGSSDRTLSSPDG